MKKVFLTLLFLVLLNGSALAIESGVTTYSEDGKFGLKTLDGQIVTEADYKKLIRVGEGGWIVQKGSKFGLMNDNGEYLIKPKYKNAERLLGRYVKLGSGSTYGLYDDKGNVVVEHKYSSIDLLFGQMFLVGKNYKYGLVGFDGRIILEPVVDDIYMPKPTLMKIQYEGKWYEIEQLHGETLELPENIRMVTEDTENFKVTELITNPVTSTGYGVVSAGDYFLKIFSSISPAYEQTIDELVLNHGADVAGILMKSGWIVQFPVAYARNYYHTLKAPNNGPLSDVKSSLKYKIKENANKQSENVSL